MTRLLSIIAACAILSGCFYQSINDYDIRRAIKQCGSIENVREIQAGALGDEHFFCYEDRAE